MGFAQGLAEGSLFVPRSVRAEKTARTFTRELLAMAQDAFPAAFLGSPIQRRRFMA